MINQSFKQIDPSRIAENLAKLDPNLDPKQLAKASKAIALQLAASPSFERKLISQVQTLMETFSEDVIFPSGDKMSDAGRVTLAIIGAFVASQLGSLNDGVGQNIFQIADENNPGQAQYDMQHLLDSLIDHDGLEFPLTEDTLTKATEALLFAIKST